MRNKSDLKIKKADEKQTDDDFVLRGKSAEIFYQKIMSPPKNKERDQFTQDALLLFPDPSKPNTISLKLKDE